MRKILIVDDEKNIRQGIKAMIERQYPDTYDILLASNGEEALNYYKDNNIDILITDIRMPVMDGLTLISTLCNREEKTNIIILSGYDDFSYATHALRNGARDYLLKPIKRNQLYEAIERIEKELIKQQSIIDKSDMINENFDEFFNSQINYILINENLDSDEIKNLCSSIKLNGFNNGFYIFIVNNKELNKQELYKKLQKIFINYRIAFKKDVVSFLDKDENIVVIASDIELSRYILKSIEECHVELSIAMSDLGLELSQIRECYIQAIEAYKYTFLYQNQSMINFLDIKNKSNDYVIPINKIKKLNNMIGTNREDEIKELLRDIFDITEITKYSINYIENINREINNILKSYTTSLDRDFLEEFNECEKIDNIYNYESFHEYFRTLESLIISLNDYINQKKLAYTDNTYIEKAIKYIHENYYKDINMAMVSNYVSLNYSYFSQIFKEYIGLNFVDYLKKVRIEEAKKLLEKDTYKIYEVSEKVGYKNSKQFAKIFREIEGISPIEYRQKVVSFKFD